MRTFVLLLALLPGLVLAEDPAQPPPPAPAAAPAPAKKPAPTNQVYKWVDEKGVIHYTDKPPTQNATPAKLPPLQTFREGTTPNLNKYQKPGAASSSGSLSSVEVVTPSN